MSGKPYPEEFKIQAVEQVIKQGQSISSVAKRLGVSLGALSDWVKRYKKHSSQWQQEENDTNSEHMPRVNKKYEEHIQAIRNIEEILKRAYPKESDSLGHKIYLLVVKTTKYLGIPALLLASVLPVYDLVQNSRKSLSEKYLIKTFTEYAISLSEAGNVNRAESIFKMVEDKAKLNPSILYFRAKLFAESAILQGKNIKEAEDLIRILLKLNTVQNIFIGRIGQDEDYEKLILMLSEVFIASAEYEEAIRFLLEKEEHFIQQSDEMKQKYNILLATSYVWTHQFESAHDRLETASNLKLENTTNSSAEIVFQMAKNEQFQSNFIKAAELYEKALEMFTQNEDIRGKIKCLNNLGMILHTRLNDDRNLERALSFYRQSSELSRSIDDDTGIARAFYNIAAVRSQRGENDKALQDYITSLSFFEKGNNLYGKALTHAALGIVYGRLRNYERQYFYSNEALEGYINLKNKDNLGQQAGEVADAAKDLGDMESFFIYNYVSFVLRRANQDNYWQTNLGILKTHKNLNSEEKFDSMLVKAKKRAEEIANRVGYIQMDFSIPWD